MTSSGNSHTMVDACSADCGSLCRMDKWSGVGMRRLSWPKVAPCAVALALLLAVPAHSSGDAISGYVDEHGGEVCAFISDQPNLARSEEHTSELQSRGHLVFRLLL